MRDPEGQSPARILFLPGAAAHLPVTLLISPFLTLRTRIPQLYPLEH